MMYRCLLTLSLCMGLMAAATMSDAQAIKNGGAEKGRSKWKLRRGWFVDCNHARKGKCSFAYKTNRSKNTPIAWQDFHIKKGGLCQLTVHIRSDLKDPPFWRDGEPTRTGVSVQLWNRTGRGALVPLDLARQNVYRKGYRGQGGRKKWTKYVGRVRMAAGNWQIRLYMHPVRSRVGGRIRKIANAKGRVWVDDIKLIELQ